ncbi:DUF3429 domain-containing protein [Paracoccaceae bacterium]|nr:DUF3429 domain-containing protein [Paracoccaceae bacterium]
MPTHVLVASFLGLIPIFLGLLSTFNIGISEFLDLNFVEISIVYSGFILCFMSGCVFVISSNDIDKIHYFWVSILTVLIAIVSIVVPFMQTFILALGFLTILEVERKLFKLNALPEWWLNLRFPMTFVVVTLLIFIGFRM